MTHFTPCPKPAPREKRPRKPIARGKVKKRPKSAATWAEQYGSKERVTFVKALPCASCGVVGYSENAHIGRRSGMSLKGPYTEVGPLCRNRLGVEGCHSLRPSEIAQRHPGFNAVDVAAETERKWRESQGESTSLVEQLAHNSRRADA